MKKAGNNWASSNWSAWLFWAEESTNVKGAAFSYSCNTGQSSDCTSLLQHVQVTPSRTRTCVEYVLCLLFIFGGGPLKVIPSGEAEAGVLSSSIVLLPSVDALNDRLTVRESSSVSALLRPVCVSWQRTPVIGETQMRCLMGAECLQIIRCGINLHLQYLLESVDLLHHDWSVIIVSFAAGV